MIRVISKVNVTDFNAWKSSFEAQTEIRRGYGSCGSQVYRSADNANEVIIIFNWDSEENLQRFLRDPDVQAVMQQTSTGRPDIFFVRDRYDFTA